MMETALRLNTTVLPGHRIEIIAPELSEGAQVELIVTDLSVAPFRRYPSALEAEYDILIKKTESYIDGYGSLSFTGRAERHCRDWPFDAVERHKNRTVEPDRNGII